MTLIEDTTIDLSFAEFFIAGLEAPQHIAFTWGTGWEQALRRHNINDLSIDIIIASDILLYVSAYPALVASLLEIFQSNPVTEFIMSWNRRIAESAQFFQQMQQAGFECEHLGSCIYSFTFPHRSSSSC